LSIVSIEVMVLIRDRDEMRVLSLVVYKTKRRGPKTELWGTLQEQV